MPPILQHSISLQSFPFILSRTCRKSISVLGWDWHESLRKRSSKNFHILGAVERESEFEVDPVKAREALRKLDEQLQTLATKPANPPKVKPPYLNRARGPETTEISEFEVDPVKAREALRKLDEQIQSLATKPVNPTKVKPPYLDSVRDPIQTETTEISGSFLASLASVLVILTIFYNVLFLAVIKPAIDGPEPVETTSFDIEAEKRTTMQEF